MLSNVLLGALMAVGVAAAPLENRDVRVIDEVKTVYQTVTAGQPLPTSSPVKAVVHAVPTPAAKPVNDALNKGANFLQAAPPKQINHTGAGPVIGGSATDKDSILAAANRFRGLAGLPEFTWNEALGQNTAYTGQMNGGVNENHHLGPGSMGQCITPGQSAVQGKAAQLGMSGFEIAYITWLCEVPDYAPLQPSSNSGMNLCEIMQDTVHMNLAGDVGHWKILTNKDYKSINCDFTKNPQASDSDMFQGIWVCDFGY